MSVRPRAAAIVFDLDGTVIHSAPDIHAAVNAMLADESTAAPDLEPLDLATVTSFIGNGVPKLVERVMRVRNLPADQHARLVSSMMRHYSAQNSALTRLFPGVLETLEGLKQQGYLLGICTNKPEAATHAVLRDFDLTALFDVVVGGDSLPQRKPDPAPLRAAFSGLLAQRSADLPCLYVGDSEVDAATAENAGLPFALFTKGYRKQAVEDLPHVLAFDDWQTLPAWLASQFEALFALQARQGRSALARTVD